MRVIPTNRIHARLVGRKRYLPVVSVERDDPAEDIVVVSRRVLVDVTVALLLALTRLNVAQQIRVVVDGVGECSTRGLVAILAALFRTTVSGANARASSAPVHATLLAFEQAAAAGSAARRTRRARRTAAAAAGTAAAGRTAARTHAARTAAPTGAASATGATAPAADVLATDAAAGSPLGTLIDAVDALGQFHGAVRDRHRPRAIGRTHLPRVARRIPDDRHVSEFVRVDLEHRTVGAELLLARDHALLILLVHAVL